MSSIIEKLKQSLAKKEEHARLKAQLAGLETRIKEQEELVAEKKEEMEEEFQDILVLNRLSFKALWHKLKGDHAKQLSKEESEYFMAREILQHVEEELEALNSEKANLQRTVDEFAGAEFQYLNALKRASRQLIRDDDGKGRRLEQMDKEEQLAKDQIDALHDAYAKGMSVLSSLRDLLNKINRALSASDESQWRDNDFGYYEREKYDAIASAKKELEQNVEPSIQEYKKHLGILNRTIDLSGILNIDSWTKELDLYWHTFGASWEVHAIIERALSRTSKTYDKVEAIQEEIKQMRRGLRKKLEELEAQRLALVLE